MWAGLACSYSRQLLRLWRREAPQARLSGEGGEGVLNTQQAGYEGRLRSVRCTCRSVTADGRQAERRTDVLLVAHRGSGSDVLVEAITQFLADEGVAGSTLTKRRWVRLPCCLSARSPYATDLSASCGGRAAIGTLVEEAVASHVDVQDAAALSAFLEARLKGANEHHTRAGRVVQRYLAAKSRGQVRQLQLSTHPACTPLPACSGVMTFPTVLWSTCPDVHRGVCLAASVWVGSGTSRSKTCFEPSRPGSRGTRSTVEARPRTCEEAPLPAWCACESRGRRAPDGAGMCRWLQVEHALHLPHDPRTPAPLAQGRWRGAPAGG